MGWIDEVEVDVLGTGDPRMDDALALREVVFVQEQGVPAELERDAYDAKATHMVAVWGGDVVGTLRLVGVAPGGDAKVGRVAVRADLRNQGLGALLMRAALAHATAQGCARAVLHSQLRAVSLYQRAGFVQEGETFMEAGIEHMRMVRALGEG